MKLQQTPTRGSTGLNKFLSRRKKEERTFHHFQSQTTTTIYPHIYILCHQQYINTPQRPLSTAPLGFFYLLAVSFVLHRHFIIFSLFFGWLILSHDRKLNTSLSDGQKQIHVHFHIKSGGFQRRF